MSAPSDRRERELRNLLRTISGFRDEFYAEAEVVELTIWVPGKPRPVRIVVNRQHDRYPRMAAADPGGWWHSADYRKIVWHGRRYRLTSMQGAVVQLLDEARAQGQPAIDQGFILRAIGSEGTRLSELFKRDDGKRAWGELVIQDGDEPGAYRLADEPPETTHDSPGG